MSTPMQLESHRLEDTSSAMRGRGLPPWTYYSEDLFALECALLFRRHWQIVGHVNDVPEPGDYMCLDLVGERALVIRGEEGELRAFHNLCRHRGSRVVAQARGRCENAIVCPFHGWSYQLDGRLRSPAHPDTLPPLDPVQYGLKPLEMEIWNGLVFVRFESGDQPSVKALMARYAPELEPHRMAQMKPDGNGISAVTLDVNWKAVRDVDNEGYHVARAHPSLQQLYGGGYHDEPFEHGVGRSVGKLRGELASLWSVRHYQGALPDMQHLPDERRRTWYYYGLFPNTVIFVYPDSMGYYAEQPLSVGQTIQRGAVYAYEDESRETRAARYLSGRIDRTTYWEDVELIQWTYEAMRSSAFDGIVLSDLECGVRSFHDALRAVMPIINRSDPPAQSDLAGENATLLTG